MDSLDPNLEKPPSPVGDRSSESKSNDNVDDPDFHSPGPSHDTQTNSNPDLEKQPKIYDTALEVKFSSDEDPRNPKSLPLWRKWCIVIIVATTGLCVACASSLYTGTYSQVEAEFGSSRTITTLGLSMFVVGLGLSPMVLGPLSEVSRGMPGHDGVRDWWKSLLSIFLDLVPWKKAGVYRCDLAFRDLDHTVCGRREYHDVGHCTLL